jgi:hypothetical protein
MSIRLSYDRWTPAMLGKEVERMDGDQRQVQTLGIHGLPQIDLWRSD